MPRKLLRGSWVVAVLAMASIARGAEEPPLVRASRLGDSAAIRTLLQRRVDVNQATTDGTTALHWAARRGDVQTITALVRAGAKADATNRYGVTPLLLTAESGTTASAEALLEAGANPSTALPEGETPLMVAARSGKADIAKLLAGRGAPVDAREGWHGQTALMWAAAENHPAVVKTLVELGADINARTPGGFTPLLFAVRAGQIDAVQALLDLGAPINDTVQPMPKGAAPMAATPSVGNGGSRPATVEPSALVAAQNLTTTLVLAITNNRWAMTMFLLAHGADPNDGRSGWTALHELAYIRRPNQGKGLPPQEESEHVDTLEIAKALIAHGADVNARQTKERRDGYRNNLNRIGATPLLLAAKHADIPFMTFLAARDADPKIPTEEGTTLLMAAAGVGVFNVGESAGTNEEAFEATKLAYDLGSTDVNVVDAGGWTALHGAAKRGANDVVRFLADRGFNQFEVRTKKEDWTALRIADGVFIGSTIKRADETAVLIRKLMTERGLNPPAKVINDVAESPLAPR